MNPNSKEGNVEFALVVDDTMSDWSMSQLVDMTKEERKERVRMSFGSIVGLNDVARGSMPV